MVHMQVGDVIMSIGPDLLTSCGNPTNILSVNETYVVGIGGPCSFYNEWTAYSRYSTADLELLANNCTREGSSAGITPLPKIVVLLLLAVVLCFGNC